MRSVRSAAACIGVTGSFSIIKQFFGYRTGHYGHVPLADLAKLGLDNSVIFPDQNTTTISVKRQLELLAGPHIHLDLIRVGIEDFSGDDENEIDVAIQITRELYERIGVGIGRVTRWKISKADAKGHTVIETEGEAFDLIDEFDAPGGGMDVFFVRSVDFGSGGGTPSKNPHGSIVEMTGGTATGIGVAHELGHFLGLGHEDDPTNLMKDGAFPKFPFTIRPDQAETMKDSDLVVRGCP